MTENRDYLFDNIKGFLIFLVVWEHILGDTIRSSSVPGDLLCTFILLFHMSVMMFVSGYFSKNLEKYNMEYNIRRILFPYLIICFLVGGYDWLTGEEFQVEIFKPTFAMWYIVVLFFYRLALPYLVKIRCVLLFSFVLAFASGLFATMPKYPTLGRWISNLPFFLMGYYCREDFLNKLRSWMRKPEQAVLLAAFFVLTLGTAGMAVENGWDSNLYRNNTSYEAAGMTNLLGIECRMLFYLIGVFAILCALVCFSRKKSILCKIGRNSMVVYFFHIFVYKEVIRRRLFKGAGWKNFLLVTGISLVTVWVLSWDIWSRLFDKLNRLVGCMVFGKQSDEPDEKEEIERAW